MSTLDILLEKAVTFVKRDGCTVAVVSKDGSVFCDGGSSVRPLFRVWSAHKAEMKDAAVADRVIGKAAAALLADAGVARAHGFLMSRSGLAMLKSHGIEASYNTLCDYIENRTKTGLCPMEQTVLNEDDPVKCAAMIGKFIEEHDYKENR